MTDGGLSSPLPDVSPAATDWFLPSRLCAFAGPVANWHVAAKTFAGDTPIGFREALACCCALDQLLRLKAAVPRRHKPASRILYFTDKALPGVQHGRSPPQNIADERQRENGESIFA